MSYFQRTDHRKDAPDWGFLAFVITTIAIAKGGCVDSNLPSKVTRRRCGGPCLASSAADLRSNRSRDVRQLGASLAPGAGAFLFREYRSYSADH